ncbi:alanine racemase [Kosmotoga olearia]|uniref:Alanine racemase n=1 Tax=Kosmotoga olearia (strain ATCC BAA-1733 / DSM 21960 / TBF 19.5.1) TaxID=521045 RepID=C5CFD9_KOSOT|nr:alanine racemase [Kosmotoga olearia]ACR80348.1 alanine racemase [Kosmotoga olearia TBF 19.5.1]
MLSRRTYLEIDLKAYKQNLEFFQRKVSPTKVMAVVKSNAYGHGAVGISKAAVESGIDMLAVAFLEEGIELRNHGINVPILVFNYFDPEYSSLALENNLTITAYSIEQMKGIKSVLGNQIRKLKVHVNVDTGMKRIGPSANECTSLIEYLLENGFSIEGIYSHFAVADEAIEQFSIEQRKAFESAVKTLESKGIKIPVKHLCNSAGSLRFNREEYNYIRLGIASYGLQPSGDFVIPELKPVLTWKSAVSYVKTLKPGDSVSYGRTFIADRKMVVSTVPVGYGDGYSRGLSNRGEVLIGGKRCKILGRVCMDQFVVDVTHLHKKPKIGDEVVLIGSQGEERITVEEIADLLNTINYEITCTITARVPRLYTGKE